MLFLLLFNSSLFFPGRYEELPRSPQPGEPLLSLHQPGQAVVPGLRADSRQVRRQREEGPRHRHHPSRLLQGLGQGQPAQAARHRQGQVLLEDRREEDQGGWRSLRSHRLNWFPAFFLSNLVFRTNVEI